MIPELFLTWLIQRVLRALGACDVPYNVAKNKEFATAREFVVYLATQYPATARSYLFRMGLIGTESTLLLGSVISKLTDEENAMIDVFIERAKQYPERMAWAAYLWALKPADFPDYKSILREVLVCAVDLTPESIWAAIERIASYERGNFIWVMQLLQPEWVVPPIPDGASL